MKIHYNMGLNGQKGYILALGKSVKEIENEISVVYRLLMCKSAMLGFTLSCCALSFSPRLLNRGISQVFPSV